MTPIMGPKGQIVIPKRLRDECGWGPGTEVTVERRDGGLMLTPKPEERPLKGRYKGIPLTEMLLEDRAREPK